MKGFMVGNIVLSLVGVSTAALLVLSVAPIAFGGLDVTMDNDLRFEYDSTTGTLTVDAGITIKSGMPWNINLSYEIILGPPGSPVISVPGSVTIPGGGEENLKIEFGFNPGDLLVYLLSSMESNFQSNDDGEFSGNFSLPLTVNLTGDYVGGVVDFGIGVGFDLGGSAEGELERDAAGTYIKGGLTFDSIAPIPIASDINIAFSIEPAGYAGSIIGSLKYSPGAGSIGLDIETSAGQPIADLLEHFQNNGGTVKVNGTAVTLTQGHVDVLIASIYGMLDHAGVK